MSGSQINADLAVRAFDRSDPECRPRSLLELTSVARKSSHVKDVKTSGYYKTYHLSSVPLHNDGDATTKY